MTAAGKKATDTENSMYYRIKDNIALRSWKLVPFAYYRKGYRYAEKLKSEEFFSAMFCGGKHDFARSGLLDALENKGVIEPCEKGDLDITVSCFSSVKYL